MVGWGASSGSKPLDCAHSRMGRGRLRSLLLRMLCRVIRDPPITCAAALASALPRFRASAKVVAEVSGRPQHPPSSAFPADESLAQHHGLNHIVVVASTHLARHPRVGHEPLLRGATWAVCVVLEQQSGPAPRASNSRRNLSRRVLSCFSSASSSIPSPDKARDNRKRSTGLLLFA